MDQEDYYWSALFSMVRLFTSSDGLQFSVAEIAAEAKQDCRSKNRVFFALRSLCRDNYVRCANERYLETDNDDIDYDESTFSLTESGLEEAVGQTSGYRWIKDYNFLQEDKEIKLLGIIYTAMKSSLFGMCDLKVLHMDPEFPAIFECLHGEGKVKKVRFGIGTYVTESGLAALDQAMITRGVTREAIPSRLKELKF